MARIPKDPPLPGMTYQESAEVREEMARFQEAYHWVRDSKKDGRLRWVLDFAWGRADDGLTEAQRGYRLRTLAKAGHGFPLSPMPANQLRGLQMKLRNGIEAALTRGSAWVAPGPAWVVISRFNQPFATGKKGRVIAPQTKFTALRQWKDEEGAILAGVAELLLDHEASARLRICYTCEAPFLPEPKEKHKIYCNDDCGQKARDARKQKAAKKR